jgi:predicted nucleotidyltransferase
MKLPSLDSSLRVRKSLRHVVEQHPDTPVVLVGSYARGARPHALSDVDLLVVDRGGRVDEESVVQIIAIPAARLRRLAIAGDDFVQWALRFGIPIASRHEWRMLREELLALAPWPDPARSAGRAARALEFAQELLDMGDLPAAQEQALLGVSHVARAALLAADVFPLSRPELPGQLESIGESTLARDLERLMNGSLSRAALSETIRSARRWLANTQSEHSTSSRHATRAHR